MTDGPESWRSGSRPTSDSSVEGLTSQALNLLAKRRVAGSKVLSESLLETLQGSVLGPNHEMRHKAVSEIRAAGIVAEDIFDHYIPEVARRLGREWCEDRLGFAEVTIGAARLQVLLRDLSGELTFPINVRNESGVAVVVLKDEYHTLGAMVLTSQLRRLGISVRLLLGIAREEALLELGPHRYDAIMISASHGETLANLAQFIEKVRKQTKRNTPIVLGGPVLEQAIDVKAVTGVDVSTSDVYEAIRECRLKTFHSVGAETQIEKYAVRDLVPAGRAIS